jgi:aspartate carbamoyltransferase catalytic subunit
MSGISAGRSTQEIMQALRSPQFQIDGSFVGKDILSVEQFSKSDIQIVLDLAAKFEKQYENGEQEKYSSLLKGKRVAVCFYQPSTRTYMSTVAAAQDLGARVVAIPGMMEYSSVVKGETLPDTVMTIQSMRYDAIALRHPSDESALIAAETANVPIMNAGAGKLEHPTQALLDVYTVLKEIHKKPENMHITFVADLKNGRTVHSLACMMATMGTRRISCVSPDMLRMPKAVVKQLREQGVEVTEHEALQEVAGETDLVYMTRVQKEWFSDEASYSKACQGTRMTLEMMKLLKPEARVMHPLPRVDEIDLEVDADPRAVYFKQVANGLWVRMALWALILGAKV